MKELKTTLTTYRPAGALVLGALRRVLREVRAEQLPRVLVPVPEVHVPEPDLKQRPLLDGPAAAPELGDRAPVPEHRDLLPSDAAFVVLGPVQERNDVRDELQVEPFRVGVLLAEPAVGERKDYDVRESVHGLLLCSPNGLREEGVRRDILPARHGHLFGLQVDEELPLHEASGFLGDGGVNGPVGGVVLVLRGAAVLVRRLQNAHGLPHDVVDAHPAVGVILQGFEHVRVEVVPQQLLGGRPVDHVALRPVDGFGRRERPAEERHHGGRAVPLGVVVAVVFVVGVVASAEKGQLLSLSCRLRSPTTHRG